MTSYSSLVIGLTDVKGRVCNLSLSETNLVVVVIKPLSELVVWASLGVSQSFTALSEHKSLVLNFGVCVQFVQMLIVSYNSRLRYIGIITVVEVRADQSLCFKFLIEKHLVGSAEISALKVVLSGTVTQEEVVRDSIFQIALTKNSYDRWNKQSTYS